MRKPGTLDLSYVTDRRERKINSPLEGESARRGRSPKSRRWGEFFLWHVPPPNRPSQKTLGLFDSPSRGELIAYLALEGMPLKGGVDLCSSRRGGHRLFIPPCKEASAVSGERIQCFPNPPLTGEKPHFHPVATFRRSPYIKSRNTLIKNTPEVERTLPFRAGAPPMRRMKTTRNS